MKVAIAICDVAKPNLIIKQATRNLVMRTSFQVFVVICHFLVFFVLFFYVGLTVGVQVKSLCWAEFHISM
jgi:hypothetical protein